MGLSFSHMSGIKVKNQLLPKKSDFETRQQGGLREFFSKKPFLREITTQR